MFNLPQETRTEKNLKFLLYQMILEETEEREEQEKDLVKSPNLVK